MSATVAAISNLKGGVGKSTTTVMLAEGLAYYYGAEVLIIDLDPQANSSQMLLAERGLQMAFNQGKGVQRLLEQFLDDKPPNLSNLILPNAVTIEELRKAEEIDKREGWVSIMPAHPELRFAEMMVEERLYNKGIVPSELAQRLADHIRIAIEPLLGLYDVILLDTPPYLSPLARAGLNLSDYFITPTLADSVSIWGTKQFTDWIKSQLVPDLPERNFVVITRFRNTRYAREAETELKSIYLKDRTFGPTIPESTQVLSAMDRPALDSYDTMRGKYGRLRTDVAKLAESFAEFVASRTGEPAPAKVRT